MLLGQRVKAGRLTRGPRVNNNALSQDLPHVELKGLHLSSSNTDRASRRHHFTTLAIGMVQSQRCTAISKTCKALISYASKHGHSSGTFREKVYHISVNATKTGLL